MGVLPHVETLGTDRDQLDRLSAQSWAVTSERGLEVLHFAPAAETLEHKSLAKGVSFQRRLDDLGITDGPARDDWEQMLVTTEGAHRRALRRPFAVLLAGPQVKKLTGEVRRIVEGILDEIPEGREIDVMGDIAWKVPSRVYCHLVAAPLDQAPMVASLSDRTLAPVLTVDRSRRQDSIDAFNTTRDFVREHLGARRREGLGDDFASIMIRQQIEGLQTEEELIYEGIALLQASVDNTVHQLGLVLGTLLSDPTRWQAIVQDASLIPASIEEAMRLTPRFNTVFRQAHEATKLNGHPLDAGEWVFVSTLAANRDPERFVDPHDFRLDRRMVRALQFGGGPYSCLGQTLARIELQEAVSAISERFPNLELNAPWTTHVTNAVTEVSKLSAKT
ncbi:MAG: cytochrome P450 [Maritimibacter sp.]|uniref:cytochrome P450 n=1 Tax=Maritimibacter sp. TaxID=2003363 RepID=UPI001DA40AB3|nr:cytochrome P450 [Maritimibacter sp.]MBL6425907.1 cytochrome P450 [Maritimibacter sp.]